MCGVPSGYTGALGILQDHGSGQQNPNQAEYQEREQGHQQYRHSFTSLLDGFSPLKAPDAVIAVTH
jgi:hypothetical protein